MKLLKGIGVSPGIAAGKVFILEQGHETEKRNIRSCDEEIARLENALRKSGMELERLYEETRSKIGEKEAAIFEAQLLMLRDEEFIEKIKSEIEDKKINAEWAVENVGQYYASLFMNMESEYMRERAQDIKDIANLIRNSLSGSGNNPAAFTEAEGIIAARELPPSDTARLNAEKIQGILTETGGRTSHAAIISRALGIPAVAGIPSLMQEVKSGDYVVLDGDSGIVYVNPSEDVINDYNEKLKEFISRKNKLHALKGTGSVTADGHRIMISANISSDRDVNTALYNDAEGIGLFRTEFLLMNRSSLPPCQEQFEVYKKVVSDMQNKEVVIRTFDIGGDKPLDYIELPHENNPFLGFRGIRIGLDRKEILREQLKAILKASVFGNIKIMFPMISTVDEIRQAKEILAEAKEELRKEKTPFSERIETGIMIETPAAAIMSDSLSKEADFFSIGTNDLIQYTMAADRLNSKVSYLYNFFQPSVLRLVKFVADSAHKAGIKVGMCGEAAGEPELVPVWVGMGIDELSVNPASVLGTRKIVQSVNFGEAKALADSLLDLASDGEVRLCLEEFFQVHGLWR